jgi:hypothetical protein
VNLSGPEIASLIGLLLALAVVLMNFRGRK